jgi:hypothetical protein
MSALDRTPQNTGYLQPSKFLLTFDRIPNTQYFCQQVNLPSLSLGDAKVVTPFLDYPLAGTKLTYSSLDVTFNVNGDLASWMDLHNWMRSIAAPTGFNERNRQTQQQDKRGVHQNYSDATLTVLSNLNNPIANFYFYNCFPSSLSDINFDVTEGSDTIITGTASFLFEYYDYTSV